MTRRVKNSDVFFGQSDLFAKNLNSGVPRSRGNSGNVRACQYGLALTKPRGPGRKGAVLVAHPGENDSLAPSAMEQRRRVSQLPPERLAHPYALPRAFDRFYRNPDIRACVSPSDVHWIEGVGLPNAATMGRNTLFTGATNNSDMSLEKTIVLRDRAHLEIRWEAQNAFNHPEFVQVPF